MCESEQVRNENPHMSYGTRDVIGTSCSLAELMLGMRRRELGCVWYTVWGFPKGHQEEGAHGGRLRAVTSVAPAVGLSEESGQQQQQESGGQVGTVALPRLSISVAGHGTFREPAESTRLQPQGGE